MGHNDRTHLLALDADGQQAMAAAARHAIAYRATLDAGDVAPRMRPAEMVGRFDAELPDAGQDALSVIDDLAGQATDGSHGHASLCRAGDRAGGQGCYG